MLNFSCVMSLPFVALLFGELPLIEGEIQKRGALKLIFSIFIVVSSTVQINIVDSHT